MAKQKINKSKNTALESHKKSDKAKWAITFISLILIATLLGGLSFYIVNNNKTSNPPAIEQGQEQGKTEEPTVSVRNYKSVNDFITADSQQLTQSYLNDVKINDPQQRAYINIDLKLTIPLKLKFFEQTTEGECLGEINIEKVDYKGLYCKPDKFHIGILNITYDDLITVFPALANYQLSTFDYLNEGKLGQVVGEDYFFANNGHRFYLNQEDPGKPAIRIATSNEGASEMPSDKVVELQQLEIGVVLQKIV